MNRRFIRLWTIMSPGDVDQPIIINLDIEQYENHILGIFINIFTEYHAFIVEYFLVIAS